jgi:hypothetical protein
MTANSIFSFFNDMQNANWLTLALIAITAFYAWITQKILRANESMVLTMKNQQDAEMRPYIDVTMNVRTGTQILRLSIKNVGRTTAALLRLSIDKDFHQFRDKRPERNLANHQAFSTAIESFPPNSELLFDLGTGPDIYSNSNGDNLCPLLFKITARYSSNSKIIIEESTIDLRPYINTSVPTEPVVEELSRLRDELSKIKKSSSTEPIADEISKLSGQISGYKRKILWRVSKSVRPIRFK